VVFRRCLLCQAFLKSTQVCFASIFFGQEARHAQKGFHAPQAVFETFNVFRAKALVSTNTYRWKYSQLTPLEDCVSSQPV